eukprot:scaffold1844_cov403-Pavlova_lutheri.AAC.2
MPLHTTGGVGWFDRSNPWTFARGHDPVPSSPFHPSIHPSIPPSSVTHDDRNAMRSAVAVANTVHSMPRSR